MSVRSFALCSVCIYLSSSLFPSGRNRARTAAPRTAAAAANGRDHYSFVVSASGVRSLRAKSGQFISEGERNTHEPVRVFRRRVSAVAHAPVRSSNALTGIYHFLIVEMKTYHSMTWSHDWLVSLCHKLSPHAAPVIPNHWRRSDGPRVNVTPSLAILASDYCVILPSTTYSYFSLGCHR